MRVDAALALARACGVARLDALLLLAHQLHCERVWLLAHDDFELTPGALALYRSDLARRADNVPLAYLLGRREFHGLELIVSSDVLVPRPETEGLVDWALQLLDANQSAWPAPRVVDLGTGSGAIALAVKHRYARASVTATDFSAAALVVAQRNAVLHDLTIHFTQGCWWQATGEQRFEVALSNPPYVAGDDTHLAALRHEPRAALTPEGDGLSALQDIIDGAPARLVPGAWLLLEHGHDQASAVRARLTQQGFIDVDTRADLAGLARCSGGRLPLQSVARV